jgi:hypothetical protein
MKLNMLAVSGVALCAFLAAPALAQDQNRVDAGGMPTTHSTPQEQAATADLNSQVTNTNESSDQKASTQATTTDSQYQAQQQQYQNQMQQNQQAQQDYQQKSAAYDDQAKRYESLRARYAAERARYHRGIWPERFSRWTLDESDPGLVGQRVEILNGDHVGTVEQVAHTPNGHVEALLVRLDSTRMVWIDDADVRYDRGDGIVMTNLDRADLGQMAAESFG